MKMLVLDVSAFIEGRARDKQAVATDFDHACRTIGFLVVSGHGVPESVQTALYEAGKGFVDQPLAQKLKVRRLRLLHYPTPEQELESGQLRCGEHTDLCALTILRNESVPGGLEVRGRDGHWIAAPALPNTFVVNIGDLMMRWTNDRWTSTPHRVAVPLADQRGTSRRLSIA